MPKLTFTNDELNKYFNGNTRHKAYDETVTMSEALKVHAEGTYPQKMVEERRPSESLAVKNYRQKIWKPITKPTWGKVITELNKIRRSAEWSIKYDQTKMLPRIIEEERLDAYCERSYPFFTSITNWVFKVLMPGYCKDPNAVIAVMPSTMEFQPNEYVKPFGYFYDSSQVIDFVQDDYAVIKSTDKVVYKNETGQEWYGEVFYVFTIQFVQRWEQANGTRRFSMAWEYQHGIGELPVFRVEGLYKRALDNTFIFESRLSGMLPRLDEALREYGDMQAEVVQHIFNEKWEMISDDCPGCKGKGKTKNVGFNSGESICTECEGSGAKARGPYSAYQIRQPMAGEAAIPTPPVGYVQKNTEIVKIQDERVDKHEYKALSAINMEYLAETPLNQSGTAKEVDKDALNNFVSAVAEDIVSTMDRLYYFIGEYRHLMIVPDAEQRADLPPYINVPEKFDLLSSSFLEDQISKAKEGKGNPVIIRAMEEDFVNKKFAGDAAMRQRVLLTIRLDPLAGISEEDRMVRLSNRGITEATYIISCNIQEFIDRAVDEKGEAFFSLSMKDQKAMMLAYAQEQVQSNSAGAGIVADLQEEEATPPTA